MASWSAKRRLSYFLIALTVILVIIGAVVIAYKPMPTCTDGRRNQSELGIDCGGECARVCSFEARPLKVLWTTLIRVANGNYEALALIYNPNTNLQAGEFEWRLRVVDNENILVATAEGNDFLNPGERFALFIPNIRAGERQPARAFLEIDGTPIWKRVNWRPSPIELLRKDFIAGSKPSLQATLSNTASAPARDVQIVAVLLDGEGNAYAGSSTFVENWPAGGEENLTFTWPVALPYERPPFSELYPHVRYE